MQQNNVLLHDSYRQWNQLLAGRRLCGNRTPLGVSRSYQTGGLRGLYPIHYFALRLEPEKQSRVSKLFVFNNIGTIKRIVNFEKQPRAPTPPGNHLTSAALPSQKGT